jgi:hypothetical protein
VTKQRAARGWPAVDSSPWIEPDPVVEFYKKDVDRSLLRENLRRSVDERLRDLVRLQKFAAEWRAAGKRTFG